MKSLIKAELQWFLIVAVPALIAVMVIVAAPVTWLVTNVIPDDGFYYFKIARNIVAGAGSTFDGVEITNGYHPLWMVIILPFFALFSDEVAMRLSLALCGVLFVGSAAILWVIAYRWGLSRIARMFGTAFFLFNPFLVFEMMNGLETALTTFLLLATFMVLDAKGTTVRGAAIVGLMMGLAVLARLDFAIYAVGFLVWYGVRPLVARPERLRQLAAYCFSVAILFLPWFTFNFVAYGMFATPASSINPIVTRELILANNEFTSFALVKGTISAVYDQMEYVIRSLGAAEIVFVALGLVFVTRLFSLQGAIVRKEPGLFLVASFVLYFFVNAAGILTGRTWYFVLISAFAAYVIAEAVDALRARISPGRIRTYILFGFALLIATLFGLRLIFEILK